MGVLNCAKKLCHNTKVQQKTGFNFFSIFLLSFGSKCNLNIFLKDFVRFTYLICRSAWKGNLFTQEHHEAPVLITAVLESFSVLTYLRVCWGNCRGFSSSHSLCGKMQHLTTRLDQYKNHLHRRSLQLDIHYSWCWDELVMHLQLTF